jgi:hypothetical protein
VGAVHLGKYNVLSFLENIEDDFLLINASATIYFQSFGSEGLAHLGKKMFYPDFLLIHCYCVFSEV